MSRTQISDSLESLHKESEPIVTVQHLVKRYGQFVAVKRCFLLNKGRRDFWNHWTQRCWQDHRRGVHLRASSAGFRFNQYSRALAAEGQEGDKRISRRSAPRKHDASAPQSGGSIEALRLFLSEPSGPGWHARDPWDQPRQEFRIQEIVWWSEAEAVDSARLGAKPQDCHSG